MNQSSEDVKGMMAMLLERAKEMRESFGYSGDEKMMPSAFIFGDSITIMMLCWRNNREKYLMAAGANLAARKQKAKSLSFVTDSRWVSSEDFAKHFHLPDPQVSKDVEGFVDTYHRILKEHGGEIKNLPREVWQEAVVVFTNGPGIPLTIQMAPYVEGENDTIKWLEDSPSKPKNNDEHRSKSDLLTDWWK